MTPGAPQQCKCTDCLICPVTTCSTVDVTWSFTGNPVGNDCDNPLLVSGSETLQVGAACKWEAVIGSTPTHGDVLLRTSIGSPANWHFFLYKASNPTSPETIYRTRLAGGMPGACSGVVASDVPFTGGPALCPGVFTGDVTIVYNP